MSDEAVLAELCILHPLRLLTLMRVLTSIRVATRGPRQLLALLYASRTTPRSWTRALEVDLSHIAQSNCLSELRNAPLSDWFVFFRAHPLASKKVVLRAVADTNWATAVEKEITAVVSTYCLICGKGARDRQALAVMCRAHGSRRFIRSFVGAELTCLVCGMIFVSRQRLIDQLDELSPVCAHNYLRRYRPLDPALVEELDVASRSEFSRRARLEGAHGVRAFGPYLRVFILDGEPILTRHPLGPNRRWNG